MVQYGKYPPGVFYNACIGGMCQILQETHRGRGVFSLVPKGEMCGVFRRESPREMIRAAVRNF